MTIPVTNLRTKAVETAHSYHLTGGIYGVRTVDGSYGLCPTTDLKIVALNGVNKPQELSPALRKLGLTLLGYEEIFLSDRPNQSVWYLVERKRGNYAANHLWGSIAYNARRAGDADMAAIARDIAFSLETSSLRLRDVSRQYRVQNEYAVQTGVKPGREFDNLLSFDLQMNLHSLLVEMCSARDYLARFASEKVFGGLGIRQMGKLLKKLKNAPINHPLADGILLICDESRPEGWMGRLGQFRDIIVHEAPIVSLAASQHLLAKALPVGDKSLYQIEFKVPSDPRNPSAAPPVDALAHFWSLVAMLRDFASFAATFAPFPSDPPTLKAR